MAKEKAIPSDEQQKFEEAISDKKPNTIKSYKTQYSKLRKGLSDKDIHSVSVDDIVKVANEQKTANSTQAIINIGVLVKRIYDKPAEADELIKIRDSNKVKIRDEVREKNRKIELPSYEDINDYMDFLYKTGKYRDFVINYLLINYQVRNADMVVDIVRRKKDMTDENKNYIWLNNEGRIIYFRNNYKTVDFHKPKKHEIDDPRFLDAIRKMIINKDEVIPNPDTADYYVAKATLDKLGEGKYFKIIVDHFRNDIDKLKEIGQNRGTNLETILRFYDIEQK
jgi:hypothetical protein